jgi:hypothetical protein
MAVTDNAGRGWPASVIHVNEDGWVLINRGRNADVISGMRLLVVGSGTREMRDLFAPGTGDGGEAPLALRLRRTYELLEVVYVEDGCAIAVAARASAARRPQFYRGPEGELLVWVPLPDTYTWPPADAADEADGDDDDDNDGAETSAALDDGDGEDESASADGADEESEDGPPGTYEQEDHRWEEALPLNSVSVGDLVVPAIPATPEGDPAYTSPAITSAAITGTITTTTPPAHTTWDKHYDWMGPKPDGSGGH